MTQQTCSVLIRWWHRRLRRIDSKALWPAIVSQSALFCALKDKYTEADVMRAAEDAFALYVADQYHWQCACAQAEAAQEGVTP